MLPPAYGFFCPIQVMGAPNLCSVPDEDYGPAASYLFGDCVFTTPDPLSSHLTNVRASSLCVGLRPDLVVEGFRDRVRVRRRMAPGTSVLCMPSSKQVVVCQGQIAETLTPVEAYCGKDAAARWYREDHQDAQLHAHPTCSSTLRVELCVMGDACMKLVCKLRAGSHPLHPRDGLGLAGKPDGQSVCLRVRLLEPGAAPPKIPFAPWAPAAYSRFRANRQQPLRSESVPMACKPSQHRSYRRRKSLAPVPMLRVGLNIAPGHGAVTKFRALR